MVLRRAAAALTLSAVGAWVLTPTACQRSRDGGARGAVVHVLAAASTRGPVVALAQPFAAHGPGREATRAAAPCSVSVDVRASFGPSGALARQIEAGQPADVFVSADPRWTRWLAQRGLLRPDAVRTVASNRLVVAAAPGETLAWSASRGDPGAGPPGRWTTADPATAPLGRYAVATLTGLGRWPALQPTLVPSRDAAAATRLVQDGHVRWGVVYESDARAAGLQVVARLPTPPDAPILYVAAALPGAPACARAFVDALAGPRGRAAFTAAGFLPPPLDAPAPAPTRATP